MAEQDAANDSGDKSHPHIGRDFWRTDDFSLASICMTPHSAVHHNPEACRRLDPGGHWKILKAAILPDRYDDSSILNGYYLVRGDGNIFGYIKQADIGNPQLDRDMPASSAPSLYGIAWEDPKITAAKTKAAEAKIKADCTRRGSVRIGMSESRVLASCWGEPTQRIRSITAHSVHEKWIYVNENAFLYFDNGVLTRIKDVR